MIVVSGPAPGNSRLDGIENRGFGRGNDWLQVSVGSEKAILPSMRPDYGTSRQEPRQRYSAAPGAIVETDDSFASINSLPGDHDGGRRGVALEQPPADPETRNGGPEGENVSGYRASVLSDTIP